MLRVIQRLLQYPLAVLVVLVTAWLGAVGVVWHQLDGHQPLPVDASIRSLLPDNSSAVARYETVRKRYGDDDVVLIAWRDDALFNPQY